MVQHHTVCVLTFIPVYVPCREIPPPLRTSAPRTIPTHRKHTPTATAGTSYKFRQKHVIFSVYVSKGLAETLDTHEPTIQLPPLNWRRMRVSGRYEPSMPRVLQ